MIPSYPTRKAIFWPVSVILFFLTINFLWAQVPTNGLVAYYPFNGNANDESGNGRNGALNGPTLTQDRFGVTNKAYDFDGLNDNIIVGDHASLKTSDFTYSFWMRPTDYGICSIDYPNIATMVMAKYDYYKGFIIYNNPAGNYNIRPHSPTSTTVDNSLLSGGTVALNQWAHMTYTKSGQTVKIYVNGVQSSTATFVGTYGTSSDNLYIGSGPWQSDEFFKGKLDDVRVYNRGLSDAEVQNLYQAEAPVSLITGLIAYYPFNGDANDASGNNNNGTVNGATLTTDRFGVVNRAYDFDGNGFIRVEDTTLLDLTDQLTLSVWAYERGTSYNGARIIDKITAGEGDGYLFDITRESPNRLRFFGASSSSTYIDPTSTRDHPLNKWTHLVVTFNRGMVSFYVDGVAAGSQNFSSVTAVATNSLPLLIGASQGPLSTRVEWFNGKLDEIRIYNRALSTNEVQNLYQIEAPAIGPTNGLIAYYPFHGNANDASGNNNNGTVQGATLVPDRRGTPNGAYRFADGAKIVVANSPSLTLNNAYSFSGWFKLRSFEGRDGNTGAMSTTMGNQVLFSKNCDGDRLYFYLSPSPDGIPRLRFRGGAHPSVMGVVNPVRLDTWVHVAITYDINAGSNLFINGILEGFSGTPTDLASTNQSNLIIGGMSCWPYFFNGDLDDFRFYNRALATSEVKSIFIAENGPIQSIKTGSWLDPTTWSCSCIPTSANAVEVKHVVNVPAAQTGFAYSLKYGVGGRVDLDANAKLQLIQE